MAGKAKFNLNSLRLLDIIKIVLVALMAVICIVICAQAYNTVSYTHLTLPTIA